MGPFDRDSVCYLIARTPERAAAFAHNRRLPHYVVVRRIEDLPRERRINIVLVGMRDCHLHPEYELFFGGGYMEKFAANVYYEHEVR